LTEIEGAHAAELREIERRYERREKRRPDHYESLRVEVVQQIIDREKMMARMLRRHLRCPIGDARFLEVGCGDGANLLTLLRLGAQAHNLAGCDLLPARIEEAAARLPGGVTLYVGDATAMEVTAGSFDVVVQSTVFSSILSNDAQAAVAHSMIRALAPGGGVLWFDLRWSNPSNRDVRKVGAKRIRTLFGSDAIVESHSMLLAPPIARMVARGGPQLLAIASAVLPLRSHSMCWLRVRAHQ
jgi:SAM-dependent methyltransferase